MDSSWRGTVSAALPSQATVGVPTPRDPFSGPLDNIEPWNFKVLATLMFLVTFLSLGENFTVMLVTYRFKQLRQPLNYIIVNLSLADFLMSFIGGTISFLTNLYGYFFLGAWACVLEAFAVTYLGEYRWEFSVAALLGITITRVSFKKLYSNPLILYSNERAVGRLSTAVAAFMVNRIRIVALWSLAVLAFERYFVICRPLGNIHLQGKHAALGLLFIWVFSFIWTIPPILGWSSYTVSPIGTTCEPNWYSTEYNDHTYIIAFFITCFIMPLTMIFISYGKLIKKLRKVATTQGRLGASRKPEKQVTRMVVVMILAFLFCWTPYAAFSITVTACPTIKLDPRLAAIPAFFSKTANVYNPIIYVFMNKQFRKCLLQMFSLTDSMLGESNIHQTAEQGAQIGNNREMPAIGTRSTVSSNRAEDPEEHINCDSFAQLSIPENRVHPMEMKVHKGCITSYIRSL